MKGCVGVRKVGEGIREDGMEMDGKTAGEILRDERERE